MQNKINFYKNLSKKYQKQEKTINLLRGLSFLLLMILLVVFSHFSFWLSIATIAVWLFCFVFLLFKHYKIHSLFVYNDTMAEVIENEYFAYKNNDFSKFDSGKEFINQNHNYTWDLDVFGLASIFQKINRTVTFQGKLLLKNALENPLTKDEIIDIQTSSQNLKSQIDNIYKFWAYGKIFKSNDSDIKLEVKSFDYFVKNKLVTFLSFALPIIFLATICLGFVKLSVVFSIVNVMFCSIGSKYASIYKQNLGNQEKNIEKIINLLQIAYKYKDEKYLKPYFEKLDKNPIEILQKLKSFAKKYDLMSNMMVGFFAKMFLCYDIHLNRNYEKFCNQTSINLSNILLLIAKADYLFCAVNLCVMNSSWNFPTISQNDFIFRAEGAKHPLMTMDAVGNKIDFSKNNFVEIITGANMAGKSTYLRTCGTNLILAMAGFCVNCSKMEFSIVKIYTSIRTTDSIQKNQSYFFAELLRIKNIIDSLKNGEKLFIIIDEMLRGTNSNDKHKGSYDFLNNIIKYNCYGLFATHDIQIGELEQEKPENFKALCFEISFKEDQLEFDYTLKEGISKNLNASFLIEKMILG